ncbi:PAAR domain-containing protein [Plebeiibacterium sediminum]|uniref:PAAR domain-containing protein n=1 Tax=Plebeiibacterium sediminum TaxID=2992112 RepID=A0AAE3SH12_9BACT|nr:PAAR domain-containing protein [Plebeiobacterium sediminum]MCW3788866.1 PAAR domain-containing protein [Plebeiobacterium sediminum]
MAGKPIATMGSMHVCPMVTGYVPHVGGPVSGPGAPNVLINGKPAALMGDMCVCIGPPDVIAQGEPTVLINGTPVAVQGSLTAHGGMITAGEPTVMVSTATPGAKASMKLAEIPMPTFAKINVLANQLKDVVTGSNNAQQLKQAKEVQKRVKEEAKQHGFLPDITFSH